VQIQLYWLNQTKYDSQKAVESREQRSLLGRFRIKVAKQIAGAIYLLSSEKSGAFVEKTSAPGSFNEVIALLLRVPRKSSSESLTDLNY
jgi:hypothetical protein